MNAKKLAEALRWASQYCGAHMDLARHLSEAAAACEEEGPEISGEALLVDAAEHFDKRIAALEAKINNPLNVGAPYWEQPTAPGRPAPPPAPEERCAHGQPRHLCFLCVMPPPAAASAAPSGREDASPEQAQEGITHDAVDGSWPAHCEQRAFAEGAKWWQWHKNGSTAFPSERDEMEAEAVKRYGEPHPEQAQETPCPDKACPDATSYGERHSPPEQARRTVTGGEPIRVIQHGDSLVYADSEHGKELQAEARGLPCVVVELRPGERIVSGEGVRIHANMGGYYVCLGNDRCGNYGEHGTFYPDAPPRAEGE